MNRIVFRVCDGKHRGKVALLDLHLAGKGFAADIDYHAERIYAAVLLESERVQLYPRPPEMHFARSVRNRLTVQRQRGRRKLPVKNRLVQCA